MGQQQQSNMVKPQKVGGVKKGMAMAKKGTTAQRSLRSGKGC